MSNPAVTFALRATTSVGLAWLLLVGVTITLVGNEVLGARGALLLRQQHAVAAGLDEVFRRAQRRAHELATQILRTRPGRDDLLAWLEAKVLHDGEAVQYGVFLEAEHPLPFKGRMALSVAYHSTGLTVIDLMKIGYAYWDKPWYRMAIERSEGRWSAPYFNDYAGGVDTVTYDQPLIDANGRPFGMVSVSVSLEQVEVMAFRFGLGRVGPGEEYALIASDGRLLLSSEHRLERVHKLASVAQAADGVLLRWLQGQDPEAERGERVWRGDRSFHVVQVPIESVGWRVAAASEDGVTLAGLRQAAGWGAAASIGLLLILGLVLWRREARWQRLLQGLAERVERVALLEKPMLDAIGHDLPALGRIEQALRGLRASLESNLGEARLASDAEQRSIGRIEQAKDLRLALLPAPRIFLGAVLEAEVRGDLREGEGEPSWVYGFSPAGPGCLGFYLFHVDVVPEERLATLLRWAFVLPERLALPGRASTLLEQLVDEREGWLRHGAAIGFGYGWVDLRSGSLSLCCAGVAPPVLLQSGEVRRIPVETGLPLVERSGGGRVWTGRIHGGERLLWVAGDAFPEGGEPEGSERWQRLLHDAQRCASRGDAEWLRAVLDGEVVVQERLGLCVTFRERC